MSHMPEIMQSPREHTENLIKPGKLIRLLMPLMRKCSL